MKSSMAITKSAAFRFMLLLHLFLKVKMCVGFVDALAIGDSDINYEDSEEWPIESGGGGGGGGKEDGGVGRLPVWAPARIVSTTSIPAPSNLMSWEGHTGRSRMHHVRHEQHYLKHRPIKVPNAVDPTMVAHDPYQPHKVTGSQQKSRHHSQQHHPHHHHHHHHARHQVQTHPDKDDRKSNVDSSEEEVSLIEANRQSVLHRAASQPFQRMIEKARLKDISNSMSEEREVQDRQVAINRKRSASAFHSLTSNALPDVGSRSSRVASSDRSPKPSQRSINPGSKNYFEELLNNYKSNAPYYKELHQARTPQTKALPPGKRNQRSSAEATQKSVSKSKASRAIDYDLDYLYDDETDDSVQNDAPSGGTLSTSTRAPSTTSTSTTTMSTTTTTTTSTTTARSDSDESSDGAGSEADTSYSTYYQKAYAMHSNPRRNGNNRYNSIARPPQPVQHQQHYKRVHTDRMDPAKQVSYPERYGSLTDYKQANFGSKDAVERSYNAYANISNAGSEAKKHIHRIEMEGKCKVPRPKIIPASNDRTKIFTPHCTILHRCEADTGCCAPTQTCAPKSTSEVKLFFYVSNDTYVSNVGPRQQSTVTTLTFTNHTECYCAQLDSVHGQRNSRPQVQNSLEHSAEGSGGSSGGSISNSCTCPHHFKPVIDNESQCYCDCLSSDRDCVRFKEGYENFSMETRKCIRSKKCNIPRCEYGMYNRYEGRCPKKIERINEQFPQYR
ncbi:uncharacterized protein LOC125766589 isoform X1 [Anopheles funestus]|uniref:uncharacterized protein LOC125766589 isoform X1 n=1 Tax=Anopheles funestus TaxID=62324 RepID=UPI0020C6B636|nr:uncharacterized protein LOC125766589 isoform X1 [Anopheles funestus]XP_049288703.1 uncharacterized protein LOC125766589 isoform X1 [Anopheles funestus]XP_049288704.1 uncharacterized protein LOC125766589 isoform X1 [Anopheles funestus]XP_049288705.1 uncharacterized protein LOC125766589 isoform X1 [Anopheles funestus]XP_049288706.1 uncharacterized protein LOC125766589 isoform X1 [Anopheles funestus]